MVLPQFSPIQVSPDVLEESDLGLQSLFEALAPLRLNRGQQRQYSALFQPTFNQFLGQFGRDVLGGGIGPQNTFKNYLQNQFNPQRQLLQFSNPLRSAGQTVFRF